MTQRAALYARISQSVDDVDKVANQVARLRAKAQEAGYSVAHVFEDDDISAYRGEKVRPGFLALLSAIKAGEVDVVMATEPERLVRGSATELDTLSLLCVQAGAVIHYLSMGVQDPSSPHTRLILGILDLVGGAEVAIKKQRQHNRNQDDLSQGIPLRGQRPFGFEVDRVTERPEEAEAIRDAYDTMLSGGTLYGVAKDWNGRGLRTARAGVEIKGRVASGLWTANTVRQVITRPGVAGVLVHKGEVMATDLPQIVSPEARDTLLALLADPSRTPKRGPKVAHLLSGILRCPCGATMSRAVIKSGKYSYSYYRCKMASTPNSGTHAYIRQDAADEYVDLNVYILIAVRAAKGAPVESPRIVDLVRELGELRRQRSVVQTLATMEGADLSKVAVDLADLGRKIADREADLESERANQAGADLVDQIMSSVFAGHFDHEANAEAKEGFMKYWHGLPIEKRREVVRSTMRLQLLPKLPSALEDNSRIQIEYYKT